MFLWWRRPFYSIELSIVLALKAAISTFDVVSRLLIDLITGVKTLKRHYQPRFCFNGADHFFWCMIMLPLGGTAIYT